MNPETILIDTLKLESWLRISRNYFFSLFAFAVLAACGASDAREEVSQTVAEPAGQAAAKKTIQPVSPEILAYAGTGSPRFEGDGGTANVAGLFAPTAVAFDSRGNLYISTDNRVRKVDKETDVITTIAGTGRNRSAGDDEPATTGSLAEAKGMIFDAADNLFVVEKGGGRVRMIDAFTGIITTVAGGGVGNPREKIFGDGGPATKAMVKLPDDVAVDSEGNLYIGTDNRIRKVYAATGIIDTIAGTGDRGLEGDGGPATEAQMAEPVSLALDSQNNIFIVDSENHRVRMVDSTTGLISTVAGIGKHYERTPYAYMGYGALYDASKSPASGAGYEGDGGLATKAMLQTPSGIDVDSEGNIFIGDGGIRVRRVDGNTGIITTLVAGEIEHTLKEGKVQVVTTILGQIVSLVLNGTGDIFLADYKNNVVHKIPVSVP